MASEIRVDKITSLSGVGTISPSPTGVEIAGITTVATLKATTGIVTTLTATGSAKVGSGVTLSPDGDIFATGVTTSTTVQVGSATTIHTTGIDLGNGNLTGHNLHSTGITTSSSVIVGGGVTISESGIEASGIGITVANINGAQIGGRRNLFINGAMQIAQRATSGSSGGYESLDRWYSNLSGGSATFSQETNANPSETGGIQKYARLNVSSSSDFTSIRQRIEDVTSVPAGTVTLSFYAKGTAPVGGLYVFTTQGFGSGGSSDVDGTAVLITSSLTSSWVRYVAQISVASVDGKTIGDGSFFQVTIGQHSNTGGTAYDLNITGVQLEAGLQATAFENRSYGEELALCQRYYQKHRHATYRGLNFVGRKTGSDTVVGSAYGFIPMRTAATGTINGGGSYRLYRLTDGSTATPTGVNFTHENYAPYNALKFTASTTSFSTNNLCTMYNMATGGTMELDAEL